jgi:hypothetical protein
MATVEQTADELLVGLGPYAEERLPVVWVRRRERARNGFVLALLIGVQVAWLAALAYGAYAFIG